MRCPRCQAQVDDQADDCPRCRTPLKLRDEPAPGPLDHPLDLDRRKEREAAPTPVPRKDRPPFHLTPKAWLAPPATPAPVRRPPQARAAPEPKPPPVPGRNVPPAAPRPQPPPAPRVIRLEPAPSGRRLGSWIADAILAGGLAWLLVGGGARLAGAAPDASLLPHAAALAAFVHFAHAALGIGLAGRTLGKWMARIAVVDDSGRRPDPGRAAARAALSLLSVLLLGLGLAPALAGRQRRALHDLLAGTHVIVAP